LKKYIFEALTLPFSGWDFSLIHDRWQQAQTAWDYAALARQRMLGVQCMCLTGMAATWCLSCGACSSPGGVFLT
jgi:hypothetical protein